MFYGKVWIQPRSHSFKNCSEVKPERYKLSHIFHTEEPREHVNCCPLTEESCDFLNILDLNGSHYDESFLEVIGSQISFLSTSFVRDWWLVKLWVCIMVRMMWFPVTVSDDKYSVSAVVYLIVTHSRGSRCQWSPACRSSWSSQQAGWCSFRGDRTHWMRCATPPSACHLLPQQQCNCRSLWMWEMDKRGWSVETWRSQ